jgi:ferredoxin
MRTTLFCFSGTGNSLQVARDLASELGDTAVVSIPRAIREPLRPDAADRIGIVFPVYAFGMPRIVVDFCSRLTPAQPAYIFGVATYGGVAGATLAQLQKRLAAGGLTLSAGFAVRMPGNYTPLYGAISARKQEKMFDRARERVREIAAAVKSGRPGRIEKSNPLANLVLSRLLYPSAISHFREADRSFRVNDRCNSCEICRKVCPVENIEMREGRPVWLHRCEQCMACLQWCPTEAIQFGRVTERRRRYHHPAVTARDLMMR